MVAEGTTGRRNRIDTVLVHRAAADQDGNGSGEGAQRVQERQPADA
jgi:hypothetical protein